MQYVIIGNGIAAQSAIKAIRENDKKNEILVISKEQYFNYSKPLISYLLAGQVSCKAMSYFDKTFYKDNNVTLILKKKAEKIDAQQKIVFLNDKKKISFDKLLIANGGTPIIPDIKGINFEGVFKSPLLPHGRIYRNISFELTE